MSVLFTDQNFKQEVEEYEGLVLVDFFAPWCGPCALMAPIIGEIANEYKDKNIKIGKFNVDENQKTAEKYNIMSIPTIILFKNGKIVEKIVGYRAKEDLQKVIDKNL